MDSNSNSKPKSNEGRVIIIVIILLIQVFLLAIRMSNSKKNSEAIKIVQNQDPLDRLTRELGVQKFNSGQVYIPENKEFKLVIMTELTTVMSMVRDERLFLAVPNTTETDKAQLSVNKLVIDTTRSIKECWKEFEKVKNKISFKAVGNETTVGKGIVFEIVSEDGAVNGIVRLERKGSALYIVQGQSLATHWSRYKRPFVVSANYFML